MGTTINLGKGSLSQTNYILDKYSMFLSKTNGKAIFNDDAFILFTKSSKYAIYLDSKPIILSREFFKSLQNVDYSSITDIKLPNSIASIDPDAFDDLIELSALTFPFSTGVQSIVDGTCSNCSNMKVLRLGNGISSIGKNCFANCASLSIINLPLSLHSIGQGSFTNLNKSAIELDVIYPYWVEQAFIDWEDAYKIQELESFSWHAFFDMVKDIFIERPLPQLLEQPKLFRLNQPSKDWPPPGLPGADPDQNENPFQQGAGGRISITGRAPMPIKKRLPNGGSETIIVQTPIEGTSLTADKTLEEAIRDAIKDYMDKYNNIAGGGNNPSGGGGNDPYPNDKDKTDQDTNKK